MARFGRTTRIALRVALATVVPLVVVEGVLQLGAWVVRATVRSRERSEGGRSEATILCVGDSFTYGLGASDAVHSYPAQLEAKLLAAGGRTWHVVNGGWPGRDSWDTLRELPGQIDRHQPAFVCVLAGLNDHWNHPQRHTLASGPDDDGVLEPVHGLRTVVWRSC